MRKKSAAGPGSGLADFGSGSTSGFWQRIFFTSGARQTEERGAQSAAGDLPILRDPGYDIIQKQKTQAKGIADDVDMHILPFGKYHGAPGTFGKRLIKSCGVSPGKTFSLRYFN